MVLDAEYGHDGWTRKKSGLQMYKCAKTTPKAAIAAGEVVSHVPRAPHIGMLSESGTGERGDPPGLHTTFEFASWWWYSMAR